MEEPELDLSILAVEQRLLHGDSGSVEEATGPSRNPAVPDDPHQENRQTPTDLA